MDVIGFGAINLDSIYSVSLGPPPADAGDLAAGSEALTDDDTYARLTEWLEAEGTLRETSGGGQAANTLYALSALGGFRTAIIGSVGADAEGDSLLAGLAPVDTSQVVRGGRTARCAVIVDSSGERTICVLSSPEEVPLPDPIAAWDSLGGARYLHLTSLTRSEELAAQIKLVESIPDDVRVSFDPGELYCHLGVEALAPILRRTHVLFLNEREAELLTGGSDDEGCGKALSLGPALVVCKRGARGVDLFAAGGGRFTVPAQKVAVVDPTGAGDVFAAGFLAGLLLGLEPERCAVLGAEAAAESITGYGRSRYPGPDLLESLGLRPPPRRRTAGGLPP
jgi:ribokinase